MEEQEFVESVLNEARQRGYRVETNRQGLLQVDFGRKKLHAEHIRRLFPAILNPQAIVWALIETVAPGRPCADKPMREIVESIRDRLQTNDPTKE